MNFKYLIPIVGVVIILLIIVFYRSHTYDDFIEGMWNADEKFCEDAGIDGMIVYIGPEKSSKRKAYILMHSGDSVVLDKKITLNFSNVPSLSTTIYKKMSMDEELPSDILPDVGEVPLDTIMKKNMDVEINIIDGSMIWKCKNTVYASLFKDNAATYIGKTE